MIVFNFNSIWSEQQLPSHSDFTSEERLNMRVCGPDIQGKAKHANVDMTVFTAGPYKC
jgi:hypothetical protein